MGSHLFRGAWPIVRPIAVARKPQTTGSLIRRPASGRLFGGDCRNGACARGVRRARPGFRWRSPTRIGRRGAGRPLGELSMAGGFENWQAWREAGPADPVSMPSPSGRRRGRRDGARGKQAEMVTVEHPVRGPSARILWGVLLRLPPCPTTLAGTLTPYTGHT